MTVIQIPARVASIEPQSVTLTLDEPHDGPQQITLRLRLWQPDAAPPEGAAIIAGIIQDYPTQPPEGWRLTHWTRQRMDKQPPELRPQLAKAPTISGRRG